MRTDDACSSNPSCDSGAAYLHERDSSVATWIGATSSAWSTASNWSPASVPGTTTDVYIGAGTDNEPVVGSGTPATCNDIHVEAGLHSRSPMAPPL